MKKNLFGVLAAVAAAAMMTACGGSGTAGTAAETTAAASQSAETTAEAGSSEESTAEAAAEQMAEIQTVSEGKLIMCTNAEFPPYEFHDANEIVGIDVEICRAVAEKLGLELEIEDIAFDAIIPEIASGKADLGAAGMTVTEDRMQNVDFSDTYAHATQVIILKEDSTVAGPEDLSGKIIGVQQGTTGDIYVTDDFGEDAVERYAKGMEAVQALSQGKIDAVIIDGETAKQYLSEISGLKILDESYTDEEYAIAIKKGNTAMVEAVNAALKELKEEGKLDEIVAKYIKAE